MKQVKIDEEVYLILEKVCTGENFVKENPLKLNKEDLQKVAHFFLTKWNARYQREQRVDEYYRNKRLELLKEEPKEDVDELKKELEIAMKNGDREKMKDLRKRIAIALGIYENS